VSPRFGVMLASMFLSIAFIVVDTCSVLNAFKGSDLPTGVEPFWKVSISALHTTRNQSLVNDSNICRCIYIFIFFY
jgi:hypothetical protein